MYKDLLSDIFIIRLALRDPQQQPCMPSVAETFEQYMLYNASYSGRAGGSIAPIESLLFCNT